MIDMAAKITHDISKVTLTLEEFVKMMNCDTFSLINGDLCVMADEGCEKYREFIEHWELS